MNEKDLYSAGLELGIKIGKSIYKKRRISIKFKKEDQWIGRYYNDEYNYICIIPCIVIKIKKKGGKYSNEIYLQTILK